MDMKKKARLKDGAEVLIRDMVPDDLEQSLRFFRALPAEDRIYLRNDVTKRKVVQERLRTLSSGQMRRLVATVGAQIVADGSLESEGFSWKNHVAEMRLIVARPYQHKSLGMLLARELYLLAARKRVEDIVARVMRPQTAALKILDRLGFHEEAVLRNYVKDIEGRKHDLIIMRCKLQELMRELKDYFAMSDWQRAR
jgi:L-amino acid N-acyltransferase YncA